MGVEAYSGQERLIVVSPETMNELLRLGAIPLGSEADGRRWCICGAFAVKESKTTPPLPSVL